MNIEECKFLRQQMEEQYLSPGAARSSRTKGRSRPEKPCPLRTEFQRDRDRILHSCAFRRLKHKTQVFLSPQGDHYRTRLTHTLEVSQIARTIASALRLNEDLTEAIALGHDLGHTPFGHAGERALNEICPFPFQHHLQSVRVAEYLERDGKGLNLTYEVKNGIACHSAGSGDVWASTLEGQAVRWADKIAYLNHDFEDAVWAGVLEESDLPWECAYTLGRTKSERITTAVSSIVRNSTDSAVLMDENILRVYRIMREFMFESVYLSPVVMGEAKKAEDLVKRLYTYYMEHPEQMSEFYRGLLEKESAERVVCDYIAGMSDNYAVEQFRKLTLPEFWTVH